jgi:hypothetical protein
LSRRREVVSPGIDDRNPRCGTDEYHPVEPIVDGMIVDAATGDHFIGNAGDIRDLGRDRKPRIFKPFP